MSNFDYEQLDPGIRDVVRTLREAGFETTDSGDGVSKPPEWYHPDEHGVTQAMAFPHVVVATTPYGMVNDADMLVSFLGPDEWIVEATYSTLTHSSHLLARKLLPEERA